jgi:allantoate deiminase
MPIDMARDVVRWCRELADCSEVAGVTTRTFLSPPMHEVHSRLTRWMQRLGMSVHVDAVGNLRGLYPAAPHPLTDAPRRLIVGSHLDSVPRAGAFDGVLGVVLAIALVERLGGRRLPCAIEVIGFSDEEGTRFGVPFIGSRALVGSLDPATLESVDAHGSRILDAIRDYGLDPGGIGEARAADDAIGYLEFHIEQGPVLEALHLPLGVVDAIAGQSRWDITFTGHANHAGTTPMTFRRDALACAAEWIGTVEREAQAVSGLVATVGRIDAQPGASNVIAGCCTTSLDVRHGSDDIRHAAVGRLIDGARQAGVRRGIEVACAPRLDQPTVLMDAALVASLDRAVVIRGYPLHHMPCGAGHDAMVMAERMPAAMLLLRSPGGISHHPDEAVIDSDVAAALDVGVAFLEECSGG